jgi:hypothetical protein
LRSTKARNRLIQSSASSIKARSVCALNEAKLNPPQLGQRAGRAQEA